MAQAQPNLFPLKVLVISMGILLVGGTIVLFAAIAVKATKEASAPPRCVDATLSLAGKGKVVNITPFGDTLQITLANPPQNTLITVDRCSGKILHTLTIEP